jgi:hypothetical protein
LLSNGLQDTTFLRASLAIFLLQCRIGGQQPKFRLLKIVLVHCEYNALHLLKLPSPFGRKNAPMVASFVIPYWMPYTAIRMRDGRRLLAYNSIRHRYNKNCIISCENVLHSQ